MLDRKIKLEVREEMVCRIEDRQKCTVLEMERKLDKN